MKPKTFEQWCEDNDLLLVPTTDREWRERYEDYRIEAFKAGIKAIDYLSDYHCQEHGHGCEEYHCGNGGR
tara:strand:- start:2036 stop:2245 length:210 start_codon:yes stop_codon:yes gene_type:complete